MPKLKLRSKSLFTNSWSAQNALKFKSLELSYFLQGHNLMTDRAMFIPGSPSPTAFANNQDHQPSSVKPSKSSGTSPGSPRITVSKSPELSRKQKDEAGVFTFASNPTGSPFVQDSVIEVSSVGGKPEFNRYVVLFPLY